MNGTDCAWCGTGEGICASHMQALFAESEVLAANGQYLAEDTESDVEGQIEVNRGLIEGIAMQS